MSFGASGDGVEHFKGGSNDAENPFTSETFFKEFINLNERIHRRASTRNELVEINRLKKKD